MEAYDCSAPMELDESQTESQTESKKQEVYAAIERDVEDLKTSMEIMHELIHAQQDDLDTIEDFIHFTKNEVNVAEMSLVVAEQDTGYWKGLLGVLGFMGFVGLVGLF